TVAASAGPPAGVRAAAAVTARTTPVRAVTAGAATRALVRADPQLLPGHASRPNPAQGRPVEVGGDLHEGEPGEDLDLAQVAAPQATLAGDRPDDVLRAHAVRVPHGHPVHRARSG